jgi:hypothetical protein
MSTRDKLKEAKFFIELLHALEERGESFSHGATAGEEASYLFSAIVNSFYSVIVMLEDAGVDAAAFRTEHAEIYANAKTGGVRAVTVHKQHVPMSLSGYIPPLGNELALAFRAPPKLASSRSTTVLAFKNQHYVCLPRDWSVVHALEFCENHLRTLEAFVVRNGDAQPAA